MTPLGRALAERIRADGPITVEAYMQACNDYYYATRDPLGAAGDFTTAPEISQMYGELIGAALVDAWDRAGRPANVRYAELGPGRGTLAVDALRVMRTAGCVPSSIELVETSPVLRQAQADRLPDAVFCDAIDELGEGDGPLLLVASEFFDALPVRQVVEGRERHVILVGGHLAFDRDGTIVEQAPARSETMGTLATTIAKCGGVAIVIDYGHDRPDAVGDTLQALHGHRFASPLEKPGEQDLTSHVDFAALAEAAREAGATASGMVSQGTWLETLGIGPRAMALAARNSQDGEAIAAARRRLCEEGQMGTLFKVMGIAAPGWPMVAGLEA